MKAAYLKMKKKIKRNKDDKALEVIKGNKFTKYIWHIALILISFILLIFSMRFFEDANINIFANFKFTIATIFIWIFGYLILKGITAKTKLSICVVAVIEVIYDIINYVVRTARGAAITISDIFAINTAFTVSRNVNFRFDWKFFVGLIFFIAIIAILIIFRRKFIREKDGWKSRIAKIIIGFLGIFVITQTNLYSNYTMWDMNETYRELGTPITIFRMVQDFNVRPPKGYSKNRAANILKRYESKKENINLKDKPNIIVIINESFCDYHNLYKEGKKDPIEYFTKLSKSKNVISGVMYSSEYGGQTSNVEYEFLTQNSTRILASGSYVFQQYITDPIKSSLVQTLKDQGYKTSAMHPWEEYAYSRNKIYKLFGFDTIKFKNDIEGLEPNFNNDFISDRSTYKELMKQINGKKKNERLFEYVLTVQNHIGFTNPDPKQVTYSDDNTKNVYMQLLHESADALKGVIDELTKKDEKYVLLFFGDHQPNMDDGNNFEDKSEKQYEVPFIIWANYDIEEEYNIKTSTIFLQNYLLKAAGVKFSTMNSYMEQLKKNYPVITKRFYIDKNGKTFKNSDTTSENYKMIEEYNKIDYYMIFDNND